MLDSYDFAAVLADWLQPDNKMPHPVANVEQNLGLPAGSLPGKGMARAAGDAALSDLTFRLVAS